MSGHVIDGKNLLPATGYIFLIWQIISFLWNIDYRTIPVVFENVKFVRAIHLSKQNKLELILVIQEGKSFSSYVINHNFRVYNVVLICNTFSMLLQAVIISKLWREIMSSSVES